MEYCDTCNKALTAEEEKLNGFLDDGEMYCDSCATEQDGGTRSLKQYCIDAGYKEGAKP